MSQLLLFPDSTTSTPMAEKPSQTALQRIRHCLSDGQWHTPHELGVLTADYRRRICDLKDRGQVIEHSTQGYRWLGAQW